MQLTSGTATFAMKSNNAILTIRRKRPPTAATEIRALDFQSFLNQSMQNNITTSFLLFTLATISGCAANSGVVQMGSNTYMVSRQAATGFTGMGTLKAEAMKEAFDQCKKTGKAVEIIETIDAKPPYILGNFPKTEIRFKCVAE